MAPRRTAATHAGLQLWGEEVPAHLRNFSLLPGGGPPEMVKANVKPLVDLSMDLVVLVTDLLGRDALL